MTEIYTLEPRDVREVWDQIKPGLEEIKATWPGPGTTWNLEDVYDALIAGQAVVYIGHDEDGFAICMPDEDQYTKEVDLFVWIAYSPTDKRGGMLKKYLPSFISIARSLGFKGVSTISKHPALENFGGMRREYSLYRVLVDEEA